MDELALHPQTRLQLQRYKTHPTHALLLRGAEGMGKRYIALTLMHNMLRLQSDADIEAAVLHYPYFKEVVPEKDKTSIGIEAIRELQHFTSLKLPGAIDTLRIIFIPEAQTITGEAQNALLKLLEEPPQNTHFILTASSEQLLLPTIRSRLQSLAVHRPPRESLDNLFTSQGHEAKAIQQAYFMSGGLPGLMSALLNNNDHPLKTAATTARTLLQAGQFERLCIVDELAKKRSETLQVLLVLRHMSQAAIEQAANTGSEAGTKRIRQWHKVLQASYDAEKAYSVSAQSKLVLDNLMLNL
jgi:DNA polymerase-3 subunit delta'